MNTRQKPGSTWILMSRQWLYVVCFIILFVARTNAQPTLDNPGELDLILQGGRVMDPESGLDAVRDIGIRGGRIVEISSQSMMGRRTVNVSGLVVSPGFIDLHAHGQDLPSSALQVQDGVTTALELEGGTFPVDDWYKAREGRSRINYGTSVGHGAVRRTVLRGETSQGPAWSYQAATQDELETMETMIQRGLEEGALGVGFSIGITPRASREEILRVFHVGKNNDATTFAHIRFLGQLEPGSSVEALQEVIADAAISGSSVHVVHISSMGLSQTPLLLQMLTDARANGLDISTEIYPYTTTLTNLKSPMFDQGWRTSFQADYNDLEWVETGERLTEETFASYREQGGMIISHIIPEEIVKTALAHPLVMIASDGSTFIDGRAHPRGAGTFSRVLGHYVREQQTLTLMDALRKMTLMPAKRLETTVPQMRKKGRITIGADADITIFDPDLIIDRATFAEPARASDGIVHVLIDGEFVVQECQLLEDTRPGKAIRRAVDSKR